MINRTNYSNKQYKDDLGLVPVGLALLVMRFPLLQ